MLPLVSLTLVALLGMTTLAVDVGYWRYQQRLEQSAADAAAVAGAIRLYYPVTASVPAPVEVKAAAQNASAANGFTDDGGVGNLTVTVNSPPLLAQGTYAAGTAVQVIVTKKQPVFFGGVLGKTSQFVTASAVAGTTIDGSGCLYQLDPTDSLSSAGDIVVNNCGIVANGTVDEKKGVTADSLLYFGATPNPTSFTSAGGVAETAQKITVKAPDPCITIPGCAYLRNQPIPAAALAVSVAANKSPTAPAGPGYAVIKGCCANGTTFGPGLYYIYGGIGGSVSGTGVTLVNVDGTITFNGGGHGTPDIVAPTTYSATTPTAGVALYQPPANTNDMTDNGVATIWDGLFYAPTADITSNGKPDTFTSLVIAGVQINGNKTLTIDSTITPAVPSQQTTQVVLSE